MDTDKLRWVFTGIIIGIPCCFLLLVILIAMNPINWIEDFFTVGLFQDLFVGIVALSVTVLLAGWQYRRSQKERSLETKSGTIGKSYTLLYKEALPEIYAHIRQFKEFKKNADPLQLKKVVEPIEDLSTQLQSLLNGTEDLKARFQNIHKKMTTLDPSSKFAIIQYFASDQNHLSIVSALNHYEVLAMHLENGLLDRLLFEKEFMEVMGRHLVFVFPYIYFNTLAEGVGASEVTPHANILRVFGIDPKTISS